MRESRRRAQQPLNHAERQDDEDDDNSSDDDVAPVVGTKSSIDNHDQLSSDAQEADEGNGKGKNKRAHGSSTGVKTPTGKTRAKKQKATGSAAATLDCVSAPSSANKMDEHGSEPEAEFEMEVASNINAEKDDDNERDHGEAATPHATDERSTRSSRASRRASAASGKAPTRPRSAPARRGTRARQPVNYISQLVDEEEVRNTRILRYYACTYCWRDGVACLLLSVVGSSFDVGGRLFPY